MGLESHPSATAPPPVRGPQGPVDKVRLRFRKDGPLRLLSHHDLMRTFERMLRRAALPFRSSQGFHPKPRIIFALSLPLGVIGLEEVSELELAECLPIEELHERLNRQAPPGLEIVSVRRVDARAQAQVRRLCYQLPIPPGREQALSARLAEVLSGVECRVERKRPPARSVDLRPFLSDLRLVRASTDQHAVDLEMELWLTPQGTARPEELLTVLGLDDLFDGGAVVTRSRLEVHDEFTLPAGLTDAVGPAPAAITATSAVPTTGPAASGAASLAASAQPLTSSQGIA